MNGARDRVGRIRIRLTSSKSEGPGQDYTARAAALLPGGTNGVGDAFTSSFDENATDVDAITTRLSEDIARCAQGKKSLLIDVAFDFDDDPRVELVISVALGTVADSLDELSAIVVLFEEMPTKRQEIPRRIAAHPVLRERTLVCSLAREDTPTRPVKTKWDIDAFLEQVRYRIEDYLDIAKGKVVRRRGVFQSSFDGRCFGYWYSAANAEDELKHLIGAYLNDRSIQAVIYDDHAEEWMISLLRDLCGDTIQLSSSDVLREEDPKDDFTGLTVAVIGPMLRTGTVFRSIYRELEKQTENSHFLAIMADENSVDSIDRYHYTKGFAMDASGKSVDIDYFVPVSHIVISADDWRFEMAASALPSEIQDPADSWAAPTTTAMWSLIDSLPIGIENPAPSHRRSPINAFPQLRELKTPDATWLAESFLRIANEDYGVERTLVLVVIPREEEDETSGPVNGSRPLSDAFKHGLRVVTQEVRREDIEAGDKPPAYLTELIEQHPGYDIIVVDESAVSYRSLRRLASMVSKATQGEPPRFMGAVVEGVTELYEPPTEFRSLFQWRPITRPN